MMILTLLLSSFTASAEPGFTKKVWQNKFRGPAQILTISGCDEKGCHYEFKGVPGAPCTDSGHLVFTTPLKQEAKATHHIGAKTCEFKFNMEEEDQLEVDDSCVCNVASDSDLGGDYKKF